MHGRVTWPEDRTLLPLSGEEVISLDKLYQATCRNWKEHDEWDDVSMVSAKVQTVTSWAGVHITEAGFVDHVVEISQLRVEEGN